MTASCLPLTVDGGVARHGFGGCVIVGVGAVQEGLPALALGERRVKHNPGARLRVHGAAAWRRAILCIEAGEDQRGNLCLHLLDTFRGDKNKHPTHMMESALLSVFSLWQGRHVDTWDRCHTLNPRSVVRFTNYHGLPWNCNFIDNLYF